MPAETTKDVPWMRQFDQDFLKQKQPTMRMLTTEKSLSSQLAKTKDKVVYNETLYLFQIRFKLNKECFEISKNR